MKGHIMKEGERTDCHFFEKGADKITANRCSALKAWYNNGAKGGRCQACKFYKPKDSVKEPFIPKRGEVYFYKSDDGNIHHKRYSGSEKDVQNVTKQNAYKTIKEARRGSA